MRKLDLKTNYIYGSEPRDSYVDIPNHEAVQYSEMYPGIDVVYYSKGKLLEYDLNVAPKANPNLVKIKFDGARSVTLNDNGDLTVSTNAGDFVHHRPVAFQETEAGRVAVDVGYKIASNGSVGFQVGRYDPNRALVIDPVVSFAYQFWAYPKIIRIDSAGSMYVAGTTKAANLPAVPGYRTASQGTVDAFIIKLDSTGTKAIYATYIGTAKSNTDATALAVDASGNAYLTGSTFATNFPVTSGAYKTSYAPAQFGDPTVYLLKLNAAGNALIYSTYINFCAYAFDGVPALGVDTGGNAYVTGRGTCVVTTPGAYRTSVPIVAGHPWNFVLKLNSAGSALVYSTYFGGLYDEVRRAGVDSFGNVYITGESRSDDFPLVNTTRTDPRGVFVSKLDPTGTALVYSTTLGRGTRPSIVVNAIGEAVVAGNTEDQNFPTTEGVFQPLKGWPTQPVSTGFVTKLDIAGVPMYSTFLGGVACCGDRTLYIQDRVTAVGMDAAGYAYVGGSTGSRMFPSIDAIGGATLWSHSLDTDTFPFVAKINPLGQRLVFATTFGPKGPMKEVRALAVDSTGGVVAIGDMQGENYPYPSYVNSFPLAASAPALPSATTSVSFIFKLAPGKNPTTVRKQASPANSGEAITIIADVLSTKLGGTVTFTDGTTTLGSAPMANGEATLTTALSRGTHKITAAYSLDGITSPPVVFIVNGQ